MLLFPARRGKVKDCLCFAMPGHILTALSHQARFILILLVGSFDVICAIILIQSQSMMAFRVGGALESLQSQYFMLNLCFSMLTFDLQAQVQTSLLSASLFSPLWRASGTS